MAKKDPTADAVDTDQDSSEDVVGDELEISVGGETFRVPRRRPRWATKVHIAFARGQNSLALEMLLGPEQWALAEEIPWEDFEVLVEKLQTECSDD